MLTYRSIFLLVLFGACGVGIGILGRIDSLYAAVAFLLFPMILAFLCWSVIHDMKQAPVAKTQPSLRTSQAGTVKADRNAHPPIAA